MKLLTKLLLLFLLIVTIGCREQIIHNLSESDANNLLTMLNEISIHATKIKQPDGNWALEVEKEDSIKAIKYLSDSRVLRDVKTSQPGKSSIISSREDQRFQFERSLSGEIESTLMSIEGVLEARVHLHLPARDPLFGQTMEGDESGSGSVLIVAREGFSYTEERLAALVSGAAGIKKEKINVLISMGANGEEKLTSAKDLITDKKEVISSSPNIEVKDITTESNMGLMLQIAISLLICGIGIIFYLFRSHKKKSN